MQGLRDTVFVRVNLPSSYRLVATVTGSVTGEAPISDGRDGCVDLSGTSNKNPSSFLGLLEKVSTITEPKMEIEKDENKPSQPSHSTLASVTEDS